MTEISFASRSALTALDPRANRAVALGDLARSLRSGQAISVSAPGFSVVSDRIGVARSAQFAATVEAASSATANATHAVSLLTTAGDALGTIADKLGTLAGLAEDAADTGLSSQDRAQLDNQFQTVKAEIDDLAAGTQFDGIDLLAGDGIGGPLQLDYQVGTGATASDKIQVEIGAASVADLSASLAAADIKTAAGAASASDAVTDAQETLGAIQGRVAGDLTRVGTAYLALQDRAAVNENTRSALVDPAVAADLAERTAEQVKKESRLPLSETADRQLLHLLTRLDAIATPPSTTQTEKTATVPTVQDRTRQPLTAEPAAASSTDS